MPAETQASVNLDEGTELPPRQFGPLTRTNFVRYQGASGDFNPIHHDEHFAQSAGFPTVFSVGMLQAGLLATYCTDLFGPDNVRRFKVQFREQVWPDDTLTASGRIVRRHRADGDADAGGDRAGEDRVDLELVVTRQTGGTAIKGEATFAV
jgi:acyl dehydratase